jgi:hypothetical protein
MACFFFFADQINLRIYGDNIIECLRVIDLLSSNTLDHLDFKIDFNNLSSMRATNSDHKIQIDMFPGFGKSDKKRWKESIIEKFQNSKDLLDETPDAFITKIDGDQETVLLAIEFCSALQAGNQAWQRSGRAYSVGKVGVPYLYIVEFTKYELNPETRERKSLRLPNLAVPLSYNAFSSHMKNPVMEAYFRAEEFNPDDPKFKGKDFESIFSEEEVANYIYSVCFGKPTAEYTEQLLAKNQKMVENLAPTEANDSITQEDLEEIDYEGLVPFITKYCNFHAKKKIEEKSSSSEELARLNDYLGDYSDAVFTPDLPFCLLNKKTIPGFVSLLLKDYKLDSKIATKLLAYDSIVVTLIKGFKPRGDDNRPDRGIMPLVRMIFGEEMPIVTVLYGPILSSSYALLNSAPDALAEKNGLWKTIINLSDYLLIDSPIISRVGEEVDYIKSIQETNREANHTVDFELTFPKLNVSPVSLREDDVDDLILTTFKYHCYNAFSGLCNPPGGDWSSMSLKKNGIEYRWLSLPRVSEDKYKRPDHIIQFVKENILLIIESKDYRDNLEQSIGPRLCGYVEWLMQFVPNVESNEGKWKRAVNQVSAKDYRFITAGAFIGNEGDDELAYLVSANTDLLFNFVPGKDGWSIEISYKDSTALQEVISQIIVAFKEMAIIKNVSTKKIA